MHKRELVAPILVGAATAGAVAYRVIRSLRGPRGKLVLMGDSYAQGIAASVNLPPALPAGPDLDFRGGGVPGAGIEAVDAIVTTWPRVRWVVLSCGTNDARADWPKTAERMESFVTRLRGCGPGFAWLEPPPSVIASHDGLRRIARLYRALAGEGRCFRASDATIGPLLPDNLHPRDFRRWAEACWRWLALLTA